MHKKVISIMLALIMVLALIPTISASAAGTSPWTGKWEAKGMDNLSFWQDGDSIIGIQYSGSRQYLYEGTISGNTLSGTTKLSTGMFAKDVGTFEFIISADGKNMSGNVKTGNMSVDYQFTKTVDYSELSVNYNPGGTISWTGYWYIDNDTTSYSTGQLSWEPMFILQNGDKVTGYAAVEGMFEGTIIGNVLSATFTTKRTMTLTMSSDGKRFTSQFYMTPTGPETRANSKFGERLSRVTYVVAELNASDWAKPELEKANGYGLIPDSLINQDLSKNITRAEFAAVAVKLYENLSGQPAVAAANPFTDTKDAEVLKAFNTGLMVGTSDLTFDPDTLLNREQAATALTRVLKKCYIPGWAFATDGNYTLNFTTPATFADDAGISDWAKPSVYFMAANNIIMGTGGNMFSPRAVTSAEQAANYASATREQAIIIAARIVDNLKDKLLDFNEK